MIHYLKKQQQKKHWIYFATRLELFQTILNNWVEGNGTLKGIK